MQVLSVLDLSCHDSQVKLEKVLHRLKWNDFPGLQALLLKVIKSSKICFFFFQICFSATGHAPLKTRYKFITCALVASMMRLKCGGKPHQVLRTGEVQLIT